MTNKTNSILLVVLLVIIGIISIIYLGKDNGIPTATISTEVLPSQPISHISLDYDSNVFKDVTKNESNLLYLESADIDIVVVANPTDPVPADMDYPKRTIMVSDTPVIFSIIEGPLLKPRTVPLRTAIGDLSINGQTMRIMVHFFDDPSLDLAESILKTAKFQ